MVQCYPKNPKTILETDQETEYVNYDPGLDVVERNRKERAQRNADYTKEELEKVLQRVDNVIKMEEKKRNHGVLMLFYVVFFLDNE